ncbi:ATP-binding protein [Streptomyces sp. NPDC057675]|uniref:ATP-binding protein n=1 Tax=Streptomyces sp. NPDC057675 TaxID=3346204 RepID=UPI003694B5DB
MPAPRPPIDDKSWPLEHVPESARMARRIATQALKAWEVPEEAQQIALLVVSELVTNAVEHAQAPIALHLHRRRADRELWIGVTDGGPAEEEGAWTTSCTPDEHGRGLALVESLTEDHGTYSHVMPPATTHWARLPAVA